MPTCLKPAAEITAMNRIFQSLFLSLINNSTVLSQQYLQEKYSVARSYYHQRNSTKFHVK